MSRLAWSSWKSETLFNAPVINGLIQTEKYEHFIVQESFNPAADLTELWTRLQNDDDSRLQRSQAEKDGATAMHSGNTGPSKRKGDCFVCGYPGYFAKQCSKRSSAFCSKCKKRGHLPKACRSSSKPEKINNKIQFVLKQAVVLANQIISSSILAVLIISLVLTQKELFENLQPCSIKNVTLHLLKKLVMYQ